MPADQSAHNARRKLARDHYENFPVASWLLPRHLRDPVAAIYAFARSADDFADEGDMTPAQRLALLADYRERLDALGDDRVPRAPLFAALADAAHAHALSLEPFYDLLSAFQQDVTKTRYADQAELLDYCRRSANSVGRMLLQLFRADSQANRARADAICTALQLINFLQDIEPDYARGRIYIPLETMRDFGVTEEHIRTRHADRPWREMIDAEITRARDLLRGGSPLAAVLSGRIGLELRFMLAGGFSVLNKLQRQNRSGFVGGARLRLRDWLRILPLAASVA